MSLSTKCISLISSTACISEKGEENKGGYVHSFFQIRWLQFSIL